MGNNWLTIAEKYKTGSLSYFLPQNKFQMEKTLNIKKKQAYTFLKSIAKCIYKLGREMLSKRV